MADREVNSVFYGDSGIIFTVAHAAPITSSSADSRVAFNRASIKKRQQFILIKCCVKSLTRKNRKTET